MHATGEQPLAIIKALPQRIGERGIKDQVRTPLATSFRTQLINQVATDAPATCSLTCHEVVDIEEAPVKQVLGDAIPSQRDGLFPLPCGEQAVALRGLPANAGGEGLGIGQVGPQGAHDLETCMDVLIGLDRPKLISIHGNS